MDRTGRCVGWLGLIAIAFGLAVFGTIPGFAFGIDRFYLQYPDADITFPYWALLMNAGLVQGWYDHPAYFFIVMLAKWFAALKAVGILPAADLFALPGRDAFEPAYARLVYAARVLTLIETAILAGVFLFGMRALTGRIWLAALSAMLVLAAPGLALHQLMIRSELLSATALLAAFFALIFAVRETRPLRRGIFIALAGFAGVVSVETKVIALVPLCGIFLIAPFFARVSRADSRPLRREARWLLHLAGLAMILPFASDVIRLWEGPRLYQLGVLFAFAVGMAGTVRWPVGGLRDFVDALAWLVIGFGAAYLLNALSYDAANIRAMLYMVDHVMKFVPPDSDLAGSGLISGVLDMLIARVRNLTHGDVLFGVIYLLAIVLAGVLMMLREYRAVIQMLLLIGLDFGTAAIFGLRSNPLYGIYFYCWTVIALALGIDTLMRCVDPAPPVVGLGCLTAILFAIGMQVGNLTPQFAPVGTEESCGQAYAYLHRIRDYWDRYCPGSPFIRPLP